MRLRLGRRVQHKPFRNRRILCAPSTRARSDWLGDDQLDEDRRAAVGRRTHARNKPHRHCVPGKAEPPIVIDMATSATAYGKIEIARRRGEPVPEGWAIDREGRSTTNPNQMIDGGAMLPLGSERERGGHKGNALAMMVDILCGSLSGANWGPFTPPFALRQEIPKRSVGKGIGHFFGAMRIDGFIDADEFKRQVDEYIRVFRRTKPAPGTHGPLIPGDPEREADQARRTEGVPLILPVVEELRDISKKTGVPFE